MWLSDPPKKPMVYGTNEPEEYTETINRVRRMEQEKLIFAEHPFQVTEIICGEEYTSLDVIFVFYSF
jgi:hypothetical protein